MNRTVLRRGLSCEQGCLVSLTLTQCLTISECTWHWVPYFVANLADSLHRVVPELPGFEMPLSISAVPKCTRFTMLVSGTLYPLS